MLNVLYNGLPKAIAGDPGQPQDESSATYAATFSEAERRLNWHENVDVIHRRFWAVNLLEPGTVTGRLDGRNYRISDVIYTNETIAAEPGTQLESSDGLLVQAADGQICLQAEAV